jgi:hypothetical protein
MHTLPTEIDQTFFNVTNNNNNIALHCLENNNTKIMSRKLEELEGTLDRLSELHTLITPHEESEDDDEPSEHIEIDREALEHAAHNLMNHLTVDHMDMLHHRFISGLFILFKNGRRCVVKATFNELCLPLLKTR